MPALYIDLIFPRPDVIRHTIVCHPVFCPGKLFLVHSRSLFYYDRIRIFFQKTVFFRIFKCPDKRPVLKLILSEHILIDRLRTASIRFSVKRVKYYGFLIRCYAETAPPVIDSPFCIQYLSPALAKTGMGFGILSQTFLDRTFKESPNQFPSLFSNFLYNLHLLTPTSFPDPF